MAIHHSCGLIVFVAAPLLGSCLAQPAAAPAAPSQPPAVAQPEPPLDWRKLEPPLLTHHVQLTSREQFVKAGEAYFSPDARWVIFQAVPIPAAGKDADKFYSMYVAKLTRDAEGRLSGIEKPILVSPPGSANTCGWFHPTEPWRIICGSTLLPPSTEQKSGFQVGTQKYVWMFPQETEVCTREVRQIYEDEFAERMRAARERAAGQGGNVAADPRGVFDETLKPVFSRPDYDAECSYSKDGRYVLYAHVREEKQTSGRADADIWVYDTVTQKQQVLVKENGYDGGPFFSPDGKRICYRSDRHSDDPKRADLLQLFISDLKFDAQGVPVGVEREYQLTDNSGVNWAPFWHPSGKFLIYGTSQISHANYEVFAIEVDDAKLKADGPGSRASDTLRRTRITQASGADVLPVFSPDGKWMMWTAQRGPMVAGEQKPSSQLWAAEFDANSLNWGK